MKKNILVVSLLALLNLISNQIFSGDLWEYGQTLIHHKIFDSNVQSVSSGPNHTLIVKTDGSLWACGNNEYGQLGNGTTVSTDTPVQIFASGVQSISAGNYHSLIVKTDGSLWACGWNGSGQLGDGTTTNRSIPVQIFASGVQSIAAGSNNSLIVKTDGSLWACGGNWYGQLGDGTTTDRSTPVQIFASGVQSVSAGTYHSLIVKADGSLWACGANWHGQIGDGTTTDHLTPVQIFANSVKLVSAGDSYSLIVKTDDSLWACGYNFYGQLGDGTETSRSTPVQILANSVQSVSAGDCHSLIVKNDDSLWACGWNGSGQLGDGTTTNSSTPVQIFANSVQFASAGNNHSLIVKTDGSLWAYGSNGYGELGPRTKQILTSGVVSVAAGKYHNLILKTDGSLWAYGANEYGQIGDGTTTFRNEPVEIVASGVQKIAAGSSNSFFIKSDGSLWACGRNGSGQLGDGTTTDRSTPVQIFANGVQSVSAGTYHSLIVKTDGSLWACGANGSGRLGDGTTTDRSTPVQIFANGVQSVSAGTYHSLIVKTDGSLWACGANWEGQVGDGTTTDRLTPVQIFASSVQLVSAGNRHSLIVKTDGSLWGFGSNGSGQLGINDDYSFTPIQIASFDVKAASAADYFSLVLLEDDSLWGCGDNEDGQLGGLDSYEYFSPVQIFPQGIQTISADGNHSLIVKQQYNVDFSTGANGSLTGTTNQIVYSGTDCAAVTAVPDGTYSFVGWSGYYTGFENPLTITNVTSDMTITANFALTANVAQLTMAKTGNGTVSPLEGTNDIEENVTRNIEAIPDVGNHFVNWTVSANASVADPNNPTTTVTITDNATVTANFATTSSSYALSVNNGYGGGTYVEGKTVVIEADPPSNYSFTNWTTSSGGVFGDANHPTTTYIMPGNDATVTANYELSNKPAIIGAVNSYSTYPWLQSNAMHTISGIEVDSASNVFITGTISGPTKFNDDYDFSSEGTRSYIAKYNPDTTLEWVKELGDPAYFSEEGSKPLASAIVSNSSDNLIITGSFSSLANFGTGYDFVSTASEDGFIAKYDNSGNIIWAEKIHGSDPEWDYTRVTDVDVDSTDNIFVCGNFKSDTTIGTSSFTAVGSQDIFIAKYDTDKNFQWAKHLKGNDIDGDLAKSHEIAVDSSDDVFVLGEFVGDISLGTNVDFSTVAEGSKDLFLAKYNGADGNIVWGKQIKIDVDPFTFEATTMCLEGTYSAYAMTLDSEGNSLITGMFGKHIDFGDGFAFTATGSNDLFLAKYDHNGTVMWANTADIELHEGYLFNREGSTNCGIGIKTDSFGNPFITGAFDGNADFGNGYTFTANGSRDVFVAKFYGNGEGVIWADHYGGDSPGDLAIGLEIDTNTNEDIYFAGKYSNDFNIGNYNFNSAGSGNTFLAKINGYPNLNVKIAQDAIDETSTSSATVYRPDGTTGNLTVNLTSSDTGEATVPDSVTISDGSNSADFTITAVNDSLADGDQKVKITASATGYLDGLDSISITDVGLPVQYTLTFNAGTGGSITGTSPQNVVTGSDATAVTAVPDTGYFFTGWSGDYQGKDNPLTITKVTKDMTITANFATEEELELKMGVNPIGSGTVTPVETTLVKSGTATNISATPATGFTFAGWTIIGNGTIADSTASSTTVAISENSVVTANFSVDGVTVDLIMAVNNASGGTITPDVGTTQVNQGAIQPITATANAGWSFVEWQVAGSASVTDPHSSSTTATVTGNATVTAVFLENTAVANLTMAAEPGGNTSPTGTVAVEVGTSFPIKAIPQKGFCFTGWTSSGSASIDNVFAADTTVSLTGDATVTASFTEGDTDNCIIIIKTTNKKTENDMVNARKIPMTMTTFDPANGATVYVDGAKYEMTETNGEFKERSNGYMYTSKDKTVKLYIDTGNQNWSFRCIKQNLTNIDNGNGIDIILEVNGNNYGGNFMFDEKNKWNYTEGKDGNSTNTVALSGTTFEINISKADGAYNNAKDDMDKINIKKATLPTSLNFVPTADKVIVNIDDVTVVIPPGEKFTEKKAGCFDYKDKETGIKMKIDTNKGTWSFSLPKVSLWGKTSPHNGVITILSIGDSQAGIQLNPIHQTMFKYKGEKTQ